MTSARWLRAFPVAQQRRFVFARDKGAALEAAGLVALAKEIAAITGCSQGDALRRNFMAVHRRTLEVVEEDQRGCSRDVTAVLYRPGTYGRSAILDFSSAFPTIVASMNIPVAGVMRDYMQRRESAEGETARAAYKLLANSLYGCIALRNPPLGARIRRICADWIDTAQETAIEAGFEVVGGSVDSIIVTGSGDFAELASRIEKTIRQGCRMKIDAEFDRLWIIGTNRYVGYTRRGRRVTCRGVGDRIRSNPPWVAREIKRGAVRYLTGKQALDASLVAPNRVTGREFFGIGGDPVRPIHCSEPVARVRSQLVDMIRGTAAVKRRAASGGRHKRRRADVLKPHHFDPSLLWK